MEFYEHLTKVLSQYNEIEQIENQKKIDQSRKEKNYKKFIKRLIAFNNCKNETEESRLFKLYYIEYLKEYIENSISFCSPDEKKVIEILINNEANSQEKNKIGNENKDNNENFNNNVFNDYSLLKSSNSNIEDNKSNINLDNNNPQFNFNKNAKEYVPKKYRNKVSYNNNNNINIHQSINANLFNDNSNIFVNSNFNNFNNFQNNAFNLNNSEEINNKNGQIFNEKNNNNINFNKIQEDKESKENKENNISKKNVKNGNENEIDQLNVNRIENNNNLNNYNNQVKFDQNIFRDIKSNLPFYNQNRVNNNNIKNNFVNEINGKLNNDNDNYNYNNKIMENQKKIDNSNYFENNYNEKHILIKVDSDQSSLSTHSNNTNIFDIYNYSDVISNNNNKSNDKSKISKNNKPKKNNQKNGKVFANPAEEYEKKIDDIYNEFFNQNFSQFIINSLTNNKSFNNVCARLFSMVNQNKIEYIRQDKKEKLITLICALYPFSKGQKSKIDNDEIFRVNKNDKILIKYLRTNILMLNDPKNIFSFNQKKFENFMKDFYINLSLPNIVNDNGKDYLFSLYTFFVMARNLRDNCQNYIDKSFFDKLLEKEYLISFKLHFILEHQEFYNSISDDFIEIYNGLLFIKIFYDGIFKENESNENKIIKWENDKYVFGKDKFVLSNYYNFDINSLFLEKDNQIYSEVMKKIEYFYQIDKYNSNSINDLIYYSSNKYGNKESNFILNLVEHETEKINFIYNNFDKYKNNLIKIEEQIYMFGKTTLNLNERNDNKSIFRYTINEEQKNVFKDLLSDINYKICSKYKGKFQFYPYGSVTQFLGGKSSDIDIYLDIKDIKENKEKIYFFSELEQLIRKIGVNKSVNTIISTRLCVIKFKYRAESSTTDFDISLMGFCPYLHSLILRTYSLMDSRFPLLAITLKKFIELIEIKSLENKPDYLNSFSWMILLITFLQDIIKPRILPKILSHPNISIINYPIQYGQNTGRYYTKFIASFINNIKEETTQLPETLSNSKISFQIYEEEIKNKEEKNDLSCSEIFLQFLEFIIYYFKSDSVYVNCSIENEGYESMYNILNYYDDKTEVNRNDPRFSDYFKNKYCKSKYYPDNKRTRDGLILIRDPLDPHYNPAQSLRVGCYKTFIENLKFGYLNLLKHGDFNKLKSELKLKNENNK